jgi:hypothetical protein
MDNKIKYLIIGVIAMVLIVAIKRSFAFESIMTSFSSILYYSVFLIPIIIGYKSKGNAVVIGLVLTISNIVTEYVVMSFYISQWINSGNKMEMMAANNLLSAQWCFISSVILMFVIFTVLAFIGVQIGKRVNNEIEETID